jgi:hypothetical protein
MIRILFLDNRKKSLTAYQRRAFLNHGLERFYSIDIYSDLKQSKHFYLRDTFIKFFAIKLV